jgi:bifunctional DNase/RNase
VIAIIESDVDYKIARRGMMREAEIKALLVDPFNNAPVILLKDRNSNQAMPIWIGESEAMSIAFTLQSNRFPRPLSHDLMKTIIEDLKGTVQRVVISKVEEGTYYASIFITDAGGETAEIDARPSDSLALALRTGSPIFISDDVFEASAIESPFAEEDEFQDFVDSKMSLGQFKRLIG